MLETSFKVLTNNHFHDQTLSEEFVATGFTRELLADDPLFVDYLREDFQPTSNGARIKDEFNDLTVVKVCCYISVEFVNKNLQLRAKRYCRFYTLKC